MHISLPPRHNSAPLAQGYLVTPFRSQRNSNRCDLRPRPAGLAGAAFRSRVHIQGPRRRIPAPLPAVASRVALIQFLQTAAAPGRPAETARSPDPRWAVARGRIALLRAGARPAPGAMRDDDLFHLARAPHCPQGALPAPPAPCAGRACSSRHPRRACGPRGPRPDAKRRRQSAQPRCGERRVPRRGPGGDVDAQVRPGVRGGQRAPHHAEQLRRTAGLGLRGGRGDGGGARGGREVREGLG